MLKLFENTIREVALKDLILRNVNSKPMLLVEDLARLKKPNRRQTAIIPNMKVDTENSDEDTRVKNRITIVTDGISTRIDQ
jgi:hypothetical protein